MSLPESFWDDETVPLLNIRDVVRHSTFCPHYAVNFSQVLVYHKSGYALFHAGGPNAVCGKLRVLREVSDAHGSDFYGLIQNLVDGTEYPGECIIYEPADVDPNENVDWTEAREWLVKTIKDLWGIEYANP